MELAGQASELLVAKGNKIVHLNLRRDKPSREELLKLLLGPTGNLRAPALRKGKQLVVGYADSMYKDVFG